ncbi:autotransporter outer membrane beta-barrel domain-containing protein [Microvirga sp. W0021]|uniref:Autotransporter outer membrane beta-barrel domain-containing protein n=1 Tax=Hohaiivirga grylli TaxID=3133970 RepID=A0ABV0BIQ7_9HYPH
MIYSEFGIKRTESAVRSKQLKRILSARKQALLIATALSFAPFAAPHAAEFGVGNNRPSYTQSRKTDTNIDAALSDFRKDIYNSTYHVNAGDDSGGTYNTYVFQKYGCVNLSTCSPAYKEEVAAHFQDYILDLSSLRPSEVPAAGSTIYDYTPGSDYNKSVYTLSGGSFQAYEANNPLASGSGRNYQYIPSSGSLGGASDTTNSGVYRNVAVDHTTLNVLDNALFIAGPTFHRAMINVVDGAVINFQGQNTYLYNDQGGHTLAIGHWHEKSTDDYNTTVNAVNLTIIHGTYSEVKNSQNSRTIVIGTDGAITSSGSILGTATLHVSEDLVSEKRTASGGGANTEIYYNGQIIVDGNATFLTEADWQDVIRLYGLMDIKGDMNVVQGNGAGTANNNILNGTRVRGGLLFVGGDYNHNAFANGSVTQGNANSLAVTAEDLKYNDVLIERLRGRAYVAGDINMNIGAHEYVNYYDNNATGAKDTLNYVTGILLNEGEAKVDGNVNIKIANASNGLGIDVADGALWVGGALNVSSEGLNQNVSANNNLTGIKIAHENALLATNGAVTIDMKTDSSVGIDVTQGQALLGTGAASPTVTDFKNGNYILQGTDFARVVLGAGSISTAGVNSQSVKITAANAIKADFLQAAGTTITSSGDNSNSVLMRSDSGIITFSQAGVLTSSGDTSNAADIASTSADITVLQYDGGRIATTGDTSIALKAVANGAATLTFNQLANNSIIETAGVNSSALNLQVAAGALGILHQGQIKTSGDTSDAIKATSTSGNITLIQDVGGKVSTTGLTSLGVNAVSTAGSQIDFVQRNTGSITTTGNNSTGVLLSTAGASTFAQAQNASITTTGDDAGAVQVNASTITFTQDSGSVIQSSGANAIAADIKASNGLISAISSGTIKTTGATSDALRASATGTITLRQITNGTASVIATEGDGSVGINATSSGAGKITFQQADGSTVSTIGNNAVGVLLNTGGNVEYVQNSGSVTTTGSNSGAVQANAAAITFMQGGGSLVQSAGINSVAANFQATTGALDAKLEGDIKSLGANSDALKARSTNGAISIMQLQGLSGSTISTEGNDSAGINAVSSGNGKISLSQATNTKVSTKGDNAVGIILNTGGAIEFKQGQTASVSTTGTGSGGMQLNGNSILFEQVSSGTVQTSGSNAIAANLQTTTGLADTRVEGTISSQGTNSDALKVGTTGGNINLYVAGTAQIRSAGNSSYGVNAIAGGAGNITATQSGGVSSAGNDATAFSLKADNGNVVYVQNSGAGYTLAAGENSSALSVSSANGTFDVTLSGVTSMSTTTLQANAAAVVLDGQGTMKIAQIAEVLANTNNIAILKQDNGSVDIDSAGHVVGSILLTGAGDNTVYLHGKTDSVGSDMQKIDGGVGGTTKLTLSADLGDFLMNAYSEGTATPTGIAGETFSQLLNWKTVDIADGARMNMVGDVSQGAGVAIETVNIGMGSTLSKTHILSTIMNADLVNNEGTIDLRNFTDTATNKLGITGDYIGAANSVLLVSTHWNNDPNPVITGNVVSSLSETDHLLIQGTATGQTIVRLPNDIIGDISVADIVAPGSYEKLTKPVITVLTDHENAPAVFTGSAQTTNAGEAQLVKRGNDYVFVLQASNPYPPVVTPVDPGSPPPVTPPPTPTPIPIYSQATSAYVQMPRVNMELGYDILGTYHERTGEPLVTAWDKCGYSCSAMVKSQAWGRLIAKHTENEGEKRLSYEGNTFILQAGHDLYTHYDSDNQGAKTVFGVMGTYARVDDLKFYDKYRSVSGMVVGDKHTGNGSVEAGGVGFYLTKVGAKGAYLDVVGQFNYFNNTYKPRSGGDKKSQNGYGLTLSAEVGAPFKITENWYVEPQAQIIYQRLSLDNFYDGYRNVNQKDADGWRGRVGFRLAYSAPTEYQRTKTFFLKGNIWHDFQGTSDVALGRDVVSERYNHTWGEVGAGFQLPINDSAYVFTDVSYARSFSDAKREEYRGNLGLKIEWR